MGIGLACSFLCALLAGNLQNNMLRTATYLPIAQCTSDPKHFRVVEMKIERCVPTSVADHWEQLGIAINIGFAGAFLCAVPLFIYQMRHRRRRDS
jgi:Sec-independent protein secretion pathway component TatC